MHSNGLWRSAANMVVSHLLAAAFLPSQHQQQVVQAVERAKQVTMAELNAIIGVGDTHTHAHQHLLTMIRW